MVLRGLVGRVGHVRQVGRVERPPTPTFADQANRFDPHAPNPPLSDLPDPPDLPDPLSYCTFAVTDAAPFSVNVQLFDLLFEHAPENTASRPLPTVNVIEVPTVNDAVFVDPLTTSSPVGVDVT